MERVEEVISEAALDYAARSIEDFAQVQQNRSWTGKLEAIGVMLEYLGLDELGRVHFRTWLEEFAPDEDSEAGTVGAVMLGLLVGLFIREYYKERDD